MVWTCDAVGIPKKILHTKMKEICQGEYPEPDYKGCRNDRGKVGRNTRKQELGEWRRLEIYK